MSKLWKIPESCRSLPGENLDERLRAAKVLVQLLQNPDTAAPKSDRRED
jgi:hypothetical protein